MHFLGSLFGLYRYGWLLATGHEASARANAQQGREGPQSITDLAEAEGVSRPGMSQLLNRLAHDGLIMRASDAADRRGVMIELSERGAGVLQARRI